MKVGVFYPRNNPEHIRALESFASGVNATAGDRAQVQPLELYKNSSKYDVCVVFGVRKNSVQESWSRGVVIDKEHKAGKDVVILEKGYIHRHKYYSAGLNGINGAALFSNYGVPSDRFEKLNTPLVPWSINDDGYVLLIGQVPWDASVQYLDHRLWLRDTVKVIREYTDRLIVFRPHPLALKAIPSLEGTVLTNNSLEQDLQNAFVVVTHNSNVGVDAALAGVPVFCSDPGSMVYPYAAGGLWTIKTPSMWDRTDWANRIAYAQWSFEEMASGAPWQRLKNIIVKRQEDAVA